MSKQVTEIADDKFGLDRIVFFSDAVIAIAITLLVIEIMPPDVEAELIEAQLASQVLEMWPKYLGFLVSFWVIAMNWVAHHRMFRYIRDYDRRMIYINLLFLMCIAFMPYTTALLFEYPAQLLPVVTYAGLVAMSGLILFWLWRYAAHGHRLIGANVAQASIDAVARYLLIAPALFFVSIVIALFNPQLAMFSWIILLPLYMIFRTRN